jgi:hypothetical protein
MASATASPPAPKVASIIVMPWDMSENSRLPAEIKSRGFTHATFYINWNDVEKKKGIYDYAHYHKYLDSLVDNGISLILVLDMGGRIYFDETGKKIDGEYTLPRWIHDNYPESMMHNFSKDSQPQASFNSAAIQKHSIDFIHNSVTHFSNRYKKNILGFAIGLQEEHEIKYGQTGYQWRDYSDITEANFKAKFGAKQPIINYNNHIILGSAVAEPLLHVHKEFREKRLADTTCLYAQAIRDKGAEAIGYFAETFTSHDAIYATGVIEKVVPCIDIAVIDYNFFDGYSLVSDWMVLPTLANYMGSLGYKKIMVGAYAEQWERNKKTHELLPVINSTVSASLLQPNVIGFEIGGLQRQATAMQSAAIDLEKLNAISIKTPDTQKKGTSSKIKVGILGSTTNFYVWHGERSRGRNIHHDALFEAYKVLSAEPSMDVRIIGEKNLLNDEPIIQSFDVILVPHQTAFSQQIKNKLASYWLHGGALVQDMRLGEFDENGRATHDWMHEIFGIATVEWKNKGGVFMKGAEIHRLKPSLRSYTNYALLTPRTGYRLLARDALQSGKGIMIRGERTLVFGFMPQLVEDSTKASWQKIFVREILDVVPLKQGRAPSLRSGTLPAEAILAH